MMRVLTLDEVGYVSGAESELGGGDGGIGNQYDGPGSDTAASTNTQEAFNWFGAAVWGAAGFTTTYGTSGNRLLDGLRGIGGGIIGGIAGGWDVG